jgi:hypothetical protein
VWERQCFGWSRLALAPATGREGVEARGVARGPRGDDVPRGERGAWARWLIVFKGGNCVEQWGVVRGCATWRRGGGGSRPDQQSMGGRQQPGYGARGWRVVGTEAGLGTLTCGPEHHSSERQGQNGLNRIEFLNSNKF